MTPPATAAPSAKVAGLVIAAGSSRRLGRPKQLLPFRGRTLLDATLDVVRSAPLAQRLVTIGGAAEQVRDQVDLSGFDVVDSLHYREGCASSIVSALTAIEPDVCGIVMMLGDQPHVRAETIERLVDQATEAGPATMGVCVYDDGIGHPFWLGRSIFEELAELHGDKAVWKLLESRRHEVCEVRIPGPVPGDVDTIDDYRRLLAADPSLGLA